MPIPKKFLPLIVAGVLGIAATFLINIYVKQQAQQAKYQAVTNQKNMSSVVIAVQDIPAGTTLKESMLTEETVPKNILQPRVATSIDRVVGQIAVVPISRGEQVLLNKITLSGQAGSLSMQVPVGKRAITVTVDNINAVGGMIRPGDHVDVVGVVPIPAVDASGKQVTQAATMPLFQDVLVLAIGGEYSRASAGKKEATGPSSQITFALSPQEANLITFVSEQGKIRLVLRSPEDTQTQAVAPASWDTLFRTVMPEAYKEQTDKPVQAPPKPKTVEVYHGLQKEVKTIE